MGNILFISIFSSTPPPPPLPPQISNGPPLTIDISIAEGYTGYACLSKPKWCHIIMLICDNTVIGAYKKSHLSAKVLFLPDIFCCKICNILSSTDSLLVEPFSPHCLLLTPGMFNPSYSSKFKHNSRYVQYNSLLI